MNRRQFGLASLAAVMAGSIPKEKTALPHIGAKYPVRTEITGPNTYRVQSLTRPLLIEVTGPTGLPELKEVEAKLWINCRYCS